MCDTEAKALKERVRVTERGLGAALQTATELAAERDALRALLAEAREFIDATIDPPYPSGAELADRIDAALAKERGNG